VGILSGPLRMPTQPGPRCWEATGLTGRTSFDAVSDYSSSAPRTSVRLKVAKRHRGRSAAARDPWPSRSPGVRHDGDLRPTPNGHLALSAHGLFAGEEVSQDVAFTAARAGLVRCPVIPSASRSHRRQDKPGAGHPMPLASPPRRADAVYVKV